MNKRIDKVTAWREVFNRRDYKLNKEDRINPRDFIWSKSKHGVPIINFNDLIHLDDVQFITIPWIFKKKRGII